MQFKSLIIALAAVAASVSAQSIPIPDSPCSTCVIASIPNEPTCASLASADMQQLQAVFANNAVSLPGLAAAAKNPAIKTCLCNWSVGTLTPTGAGASCAAAQGPTAAVCDADEATEASARMAPFAQMFNCPPVTSSATASAASSTSTATSSSAANSTVTSTSTANSTATSSSTASSTTGTPKSAGITNSAVNVGFSLSLNYIASMAILGAAAFAGL
ncbi:hypothetical protein BGZ80_005829 [Entomortierella chlamydospora]|uniref:Uncharacterized protein n=1 Tax=Entomortierella chlamydospora TaxID=101097 RepID=A0A9P6N0K9_9FUNG|nr:hypothetical protein BGZ79_003522 [Entomortierella chlamydospora]KAG0019431.1 hypothetical protein BGZ80_005829 [Entomortierella chlamydospora]